MEQKQEKDLASRIVDMLESMVYKEADRDVHEDNKVYFDGQFDGVSMAYHAANRMLNEEKQEKQEGEN
jgi:hypothetical protein